METQISNQESLEIGKQLINFCQKGDYVTAVEKLYSPEIESIEAVAMPGMPDRVSGLEAIRRKNKEWEETMEVHSAQIEGPYPLGDRFAVRFKYDTTDKKTNQRMQIDEVAVYTVKNGKITKEEFFYTM